MSTYILQKYLLGSIFYLKFSPGLIKSLILYVTLGSAKCLKAPDIKYWNYITNGKKYYRRFFKLIKDSWCLDYTFSVSSASSVFC